MKKEIHTVNKYIISNTFIGFPLTLMLNIFSLTLDCTPPICIFQCVISSCKKNDFGNGYTSTLYSLTI